MTISVQLDTATFPSHAITDISAISFAGSIALHIDSDCGSATVNCTEKPSAADDRVRLYVYEDSDLLFNGEITGARYNEDGTYTIIGQDAMARLRNKWGGADRTYGAANLPDPSTDTNTKQNLAEASGIDPSLTSINGANFPIGVEQDIIVKGGNIDPLFPDTPVSGDIMLDLARKLCESVVPNYAIFSNGAGVVRSDPRTIGSSIASFGDGSGGSIKAFGWTRERDVNSIINKWTIKGRSIISDLVPVQATSSASNSYLPAPFEFNTAELTTPVIENSTDAQALADWKVAETNGRLNRVGFTTLITATDYLCKTVTMTSTKRGLSSRLGLVTGLTHNWGQGTKTTTFAVEFRD